MKKSFGHPKKKPVATAPLRALDYDGLCDKGIHFHRNHLRRLWMRGDFPRPFKISPRKLAWWDTDIDAWLAAKAAASEDAA